MRGALCAAIGVHIAAGLFFPLIDFAGAGGDVRHPIYVDVLLGVIGAVWVSPIVGVIGAVCAVRLGPTMTGLTRFALLLFGAAVATVPWVILGGLEDPTGVWVLPVLGAFATLIGLSLFSFRIPPEVA